LFGEALDAVKAETSPASSLVRARALAGLSRNADAALEFSRYLAGEPDDRAARVDYALLLERLGRLSQALTEFEHLGRDGLFGRGRMLQALGRKQDAIEAYLASTSAEARRRAGVLLEELGEHTRSIEVFLALARESSTVSGEAALRALAICDRERDAGRAAEVGQYLSPGGAWLRGIEPVVKSVPETPVRQPPVLSLVRRIIGELGEEKGTQVARVEAELALRDAADAEKLAIGEWFDSIGEYRLPIRIGTELLAKRPSRRVYALLYPKAFDRHVARAAVEFSTSPALILAVMREESHFDQAAVSWAGALGLMQIMPSTGQALALELGVPFSRNDLFDPATNIRFGACYLKQVLARFDGKAPWALASYNAGPGNAERWSASLGRGSNAHLVEAITFPETRAYVLRVLDSWMIYRWLYGG
jgi:soluble lytic murein transglycosylase